MISIFIIIFFYFLISYIASSLFSLQIRSFTQTVSLSFECGFISLFSSLFRFRLSYFLIIINFLLFEIEFILILFYLFSFNSYFLWLFLFSLLLFLLFDLFIFLFLVLLVF